MSVFFFFFLLVIITQLYVVSTVGAIFCFFLSFVPRCASSFPSNATRHLVTFKWSRSIDRARRHASGDAAGVGRSLDGVAEPERTQLGRVAVNLWRDNRDQTEHSEQLPGVNYIMSLCDTEASERGCRATCVCCCTEEWMPRLWF